MRGISRRRTLTVCASVLVGAGICSQSALGAWQLYWNGGIARGDNTPWTTRWCGSWGEIRNMSSPTWKSHSFMDVSGVVQGYVGGNTTMSFKHQSVFPAQNFRYQCGNPLENPGGINVQCLGGTG